MSSRKVLGAARTAALSSSRARKGDARRKILAGAILMTKLEAGYFDSRTSKRWLDKALVREDDRRLVDLNAK